MKDISGIEEAIAELGQYWPQIQEFFEKENERYKKLFNRDTEHIGRILKCHLIIESYIDKYIAEHNKIENMKELRLSFYQKASLIPKNGTSTSVVRPGILQVNSIRNKFSHNMGVSIQDEDLSAINTVLAFARPETAQMSYVERIEAFTTVASTWLLVPPPELRDVFTRAFSKIETKDIKEF